MAINLANHPFVDLRTSKVDWEQSNPDEGIYYFKEKQYVRWKRQQTRPAHWLTWIRYWPGDNYSDYRYKKACGYRDVSPSDKLYWPERLAPTDGKYIIGDLVLMQYPLLQYVKEKIDEEKISLVGGESAIAKAESEIEAEGGKVIPTETVQEITEKNLHKYVDRYVPHS